MDKKSARALAKARLNLLSDAEKLIKSGVIALDILSYVDENPIKSAFVYMSAGNEVQTGAIIDGLLSRGVKVYIPKVTGDDMLLSAYSKEAVLTKNVFGIDEMEDGAEFFDAELNVVPVVAFDQNLSRLGHGKGYYDRYLKNAKGRVVAVAYDCQEIDDIECESHDIKMQIVFTESGRKGG